MLLLVLLSYSGQRTQWMLLSPFPLLSGVTHLEKTHKTASSKTAGTSGKRVHFKFPSQI